MTKQPNGMGTGDITFPKVARWNDVIITINVWNTSKIELFSKGWLVYNK